MGVKGESFQYLIIMSFMAFKYMITFNFINFRLLPSKHHFNSHYKRN